jgi:dihydrofolate reductase
MRKLIVTNIVSLDGYYSGPGEDVMVLPMDGRFDAYNTKRISAADTLLLGARSYEMFLGFWAPMADDAKASPAHRKFARLENAIDKVVVSDTLTTDDTGSWRDTTRILRRAEAHDQIAKLKRTAGRDILVFGSHVLWNDLLAAGLVDELHFIVGSVVVGDGTPAFATAPKAKLRLLGTQSWKGSDNILVRYEATPGD